MRRIILFITVATSLSSCVPEHTSVAPQMLGNFWWKTGTSAVERENAFNECGQDGLQEAAQYLKALGVSYNVEDLGFVAGKIKNSCLRDRGYSLKSAPPCNARLRRSSDPLEPGSVIPTAARLVCYEEDMSVRVRSRGSQQ